MAARLHAVQPGEAPKSAKAKTVTQAATDGTRRELMVAMRTRIAKAVEDPKTPARDLAALTRRLLEIAKEIEAIDADGKSDDIGTAAATPDEEWAAT